MNWRVVLVRIGSLLAVLCLVSVTGCNHNKAIAILEKKQGNVQRAEASHAQAWKLAAIGVTFALGDALRTAHGARAHLELDDGSKLQVRQDTVVRFLRRPYQSGHHAFDVETGQVHLEAGNDDLVLETSIGTARVEAGSRVVITRVAQGFDFDVTVGTAELEVDGQKHVIDAGQVYVVSVGSSVVKTDDWTATPSPSATDAATIGSSAFPTQEVAGAVSARVLGAGVRTKPPNEKKFTFLDPGTTPIRVGTTIRIESGSSVELRRNGAAVSLSGGTYVLRTEDASVEVLSGSLLAAGPIRIVVPGGVIETTGQGLAMLDTLEKTRSRVRVSNGSATLTSEQGSTLVSAGEEATLQADGTTKLEGRSLGYADFALDVGETYTVHDPKPPTAIRFLFGSRCPMGGTVRISGHTGASFASGQGETSLAIGTGRHEYALYCRGDRGTETSPVIRGVLTILRDSGTKPVPLKPPSTLVNGDGRSYTVTYQNQLPNLSVIWPNAPPSSQYVVHVESRNRLIQFESPVPNFTFKSGALSEGSHTIHFEGGGKLSRRTSIELAFDNTAPKVSLLTPSESNVEPGGEITISGVAQPGWSVEIGGKKVELDGRQRFAQKASMPTIERAIAVKVTNPTRGTHVYLRRVARPHE